MDRVLRNTAATIKATFYTDGTPTNPSPDSATVTITRADGTAVVTNQAASDLGTGVFGYTLTPTQTALLDRLTAAWTATVSGVAQTITTTVEVAGGFLFSLAEAIDDSEITSTAAEIAAARTMAEQSFEQETGVAFVPRYERERIATNRSWWWDRLQLKWRQVRTVRDGTLDGVALTGGQLATIVPTGSLAYYPSGWRGASQIYVGYEHGYDYPPGEVSRAVLRLAKHYLTDWAADDRALRLDTDAGSYVMAVAGRGGSVFGIPEVDAVAARHKATPPFA